MAKIPNISRFVYRPNGHLTRQKQQARRVKQRLTGAESVVEQLQGQVKDWTKWAEEYKDATVHAYGEAEAAREDLKGCEQLLWQILRIIELGDRGAVVALGQIQQLIQEYDRRTSE